MPEQLGVDAAGELSGKALKSCLTDPRLPVRIAAMDAYFGTVYPHERQCSEAVELPGGTPTEKADFRDNLIADIAKVEQGMKIALIGVVNPLIAAIRKRGGTCLPCDLQMERTHWGDPVEKDMEKVLDSADGVICTGMTLSNGTFDRVIERVLERSNWKCCRCEVCGCRNHLSRSGTIPFFAIQCKCNPCFLLQGTR